MENNTIAISLIRKNVNPPYDLLLLADPSRTEIEQYLQTGKCYIAELESKLAGVIVLQEISETLIEIKNIAVAPNQQGRGIGKQLLRYAIITVRKQGYSKLMIGTGNSSIGQLALYQKMGFEMNNIRKNYFVDRYDKAVIENGIPCKHMVVLVMNL